MVIFLQSFLWGLIILTSFMGWGALVMRLLSFPKKADLGWQGIIGLCFSVIVGGYLNLTGQISKNLLITFILFGFVLFFIFLYVNRNIFLQQLLYWFNKIKTNKFLIVLTLIFAITVLFRYGLSVSFLNYGLDDEHGYMAFPVKMIETGSLGNDSFSERRVVSSLGGKYFLDTFVLAKTGLRSLHLMDSGIGFILVIFLLAGFIRERKIKVSVGLGILFLFSFIPSPSGNITSFYISIALFLAIFRFFFEEYSMKRSIRNTLLSLFIATTCLLKSTLIFPCTVLFIGYFVIRAKSHKLREVNKDFIYSLLGVLFLLLPWMISSKQSNGTFLYPFLGKGFQGSSYNTFLSHYFEFTKYGFMRLSSELILGLGLFVPFITLFIFLLKSKKDKKSNFILLGFYSALVGILAMIYGIGGYSLYGYVFAFVLPTVLVSLVYLFSSEDKLSKTWGVSNIFFASMVLVFMFGFYTQKNVEEFKNTKSYIISQKYTVSEGKISQLFFGTDLLPQEELEQYKSLQLSVPQGQPILSRLDRNYLFDFNRNQIYIIDIPGGASLPPGMPSFLGSEKLAEYFVSKEINYVAYSYGNEANFQFSAVGTMLRPHVNPLLRTEVEHSLDFQESLMDLYKTREVVYDDGKNFVLDLSRKK